MHAFFAYLDVERILENLAQFNLVSLAILLSVLAGRARVAFVLVGVALGFVSVEQLIEVVVI